MLKKLSNKLYKSFLMKLLSIIILLTFHNNFGNFLKQIYDVL